MANTTYFGWETPDDTDLVKDGAAAIRTLGQAIDTSLQDLEGGTTGQILSKNSNTDMDFVWVTNDVGDITEVVAGTGLSGGGSSGSVTLTNTVATEFDAKGDLVVGTGADTFDKLSAGTNDHRLVAASGETTGLKYVADTQNTVIDAAGDLVYGTAADTLGRLAIGTAGQVLKVNSGATAPEWGTAAAGALTLISSTTFTSSSAHNVNDVFSATYDNYLIWVTVTGASDGDFVNMRLRVSGSDNSSTNYYWSNVYNQAATTAVSGEGATAATSFRLGYMENGITNFNTFMNISGPFLTTNTIMSYDHNRYNTNNSTNQKGSGSLNVTTSYTGFTVLAATGNITGKVRVYGYQNS